MRIIGGRDYYDSAIAYGIDPDVVFVRKAEKSNKLPMLDRSLWNWPLQKTPDRSLFRWKSCYQSHDRDLQPLVTYVAGIRYSGAKLTILKGMIRKNYYFWNYEKLVSFLAVEQIYLENNDRYGITVSQHFDLSGSDCHMDICVTERIVTALLIPKINGEPAHWLINGDNLKEVEFFRCLDPYRCFQEISMFVGGVLPKLGNKMVQITDDKIKVKKHGFDKWSFRKMGKDSK